MSNYVTAPPSGTRDFLPDEVEYREQITGTIRASFERFAFLPLQTPAFERIETLTGKYGPEADKLIFKILKRGAQAHSGEADLALRYDFTVPLARAVAAHQARLPWPFRRYQIGPVWRADRPGRGRFREFTQCDIDVVGSASPVAEAEVIGALADALDAIGLNAYTFRINSRRVLAGLMDVCEVAADQRPAVLIALDKSAKVDLNGVNTELISASLPDAARQQLLELFQPERGDALLRQRLQPSAEGRAGLAEVDTLMQLIAPLLQNGSAVFSPVLARGLDYYTGTIFEIFATGESLSLGSGGRYDGLVGTFTGQPTPACGGSLGIERIMELLRPMVARVQCPPATVLVTVWDKASRASAMEIATQLRREGRVRVEVYLGEDDLRRQVGYAAKRGIPYCVICGPDERAAQTVTIKDMQQSTQRSYPLAGLGATWRREFGSPSEPRKTGGA